MNIGDKIVCVDDSVNTKVIHHFSNWVTEGEIYTVRRIEGSLTSDRRVLLDEVRNQKIFFSELGGSAEPGFAARRFVPYDEYIMAELAVEELKEENSLVE